MGIWKISDRNGGYINWRTKLVAGKKLEDHFNSFQTTMGFTCHVTASWRDAIGQLPTMCTDGGRGVLWQIVRTDGNIYMCVCVYIVRVKNGKERGKGKRKERSKAQHSIAVGRVCSEISVQLGRGAVRDWLATDSPVRKSTPSHGHVLPPMVTGSQKLSVPAPPRVHLVAQIPRASPSPLVSSLHPGWALGLKTSPINRI